MHYLVIQALAFASGFAALSWEVIWQTKAGLALGVSAVGTALTLIAMMGGIGCGAWLAGRLLEHKKNLQPLRLYGALEIFIGLSGLMLQPGFAVLAD